MTAGELGMSRKLSACLATSGLALIAACGIFIGILSIRVGAQHADKDAFWVPILGGGFCVLFFIWMFYRSARYFWQKAKRSDRLRI
jgi:hypothetical protein